MYELILVSESPRRRQLLNDAGFLFRVDSVKVSETIEENVNLEPAIMAVAQAKGQAYVEGHKLLKYQEILVLSADTVVILDDRPLGKPKNNIQAHQFLRRLSGKTHHVITGISLHNLKTSEVVLAHDVTKVSFRQLTESEITDYIKTGEPMDKAGAYAVQGLGGQFVSKISGSKSNVIGLPLELLEKVLQEKGWNVARR